MFKKGDPVYFRSRKLGTVPAIVKKVGSVPGRWAHQMLIEGNAPNNRGYINNWVLCSNCLLQTDDNYGVVHGVFGRCSLESKCIHEIECCLCTGKDETEHDTPQEAVEHFYNEGWRHVVSDHYGMQGVCCPECLTTDKEDGHNVLKIEDDPHFLR
jgi:hypothetical protein